jgi:pimeloyl-ACP methyl ester carboxylesterase
MLLIGEVLAALVAVVLASYLIEVLRRKPSAPTRPSWLPSASVDMVDADGIRLRYVAIGEGPTLVLLHTLRTQLDMFQKILPALAARFRVIALDLPGHGWSDMPEARYDADYFVDGVGKALDRLQVRDAVIIGESIGGSIALLLAARRHPAVRGVVAINPYDYAGGRGIRRSSVLANLIFGLLTVPILGPTVNRLRSLPVVTAILRGGVRRRGAIPDDLAREIHLVANRPRPGPRDRRAGPALGHLGNSPGRVRRHRAPRAASLRRPRLVPGSRAGRRRARYTGGRAARSCERGTLPGPGCT